jgi:hypothetical protein
MNMKHEHLHHCLEVLSNVCCFLHKSSSACHLDESVAELQ